MGETVSLASGEAYFASSGKAGASGIVVIQEWWGLQAQIRSICDKYAAAGFDAICPDLYAGTVVPYHDEEAAGREMDALDFLSATDMQVKDAALFMQKPASKVGLTGFCLGGIVSILGAARLDVFGAASCYYGLPAHNQFDVKDIKVPVIGHFALADTWCTPAMVDRFEEELIKAGKNHVIHRYDCDHGFVNQDIAQYGQIFAELAWHRDMGFWAEHLG